MLELRNLSDAQREVRCVQESKKNPSPIPWHIKSLTPSEPIYPSLTYPEISPRWNWWQPLIRWRRWQQWWMTVLMQTTPHQIPTGPLHRHGSPQVDLQWPESLHTPSRTRTLSFPIGTTLLEWFRQSRARRHRQLTLVFLLHSISCANSTTDTGSAILFAYRTTSPTNRANTQARCSLCVHSEGLPSPVSPLLVDRACTVLPSIVGIVGLVLGVLSGGRCA